MIKQRLLCSAAIGFAVLAVPAISADPSSIEILDERLGRVLENCHIENQRLLDRPTCDELQQSLTHERDLNYKNVVTIQSLNNRISELEEQASVNERALKAVHAEKETLTKSLTHSLGTQKDAEVLAERLKRENDQVKLETATLRDENYRLNEVLAGLSDDQQETAARLAEAIALAEAAQEKASVTKAERDVAQEKRATASVTITALRQTVSDGEARIDHMKEQANIIHGDLMAAIAKSTEVEDKLVAAERGLVAVNAEKAKMRSDLDTVGAKNDALAQEMNAIRQQQVAHADKVNSIIEMTPAYLEWLIRTTAGASGCLEFDVAGPGGNVSIDMVRGSVDQMESLLANLQSHPDAPSITLNKDNVVSCDIPVGDRWFISSDLDGQPLMMTRTEFETLSSAKTTSKGQEVCKKEMKDLGDNHILRQNGFWLHSDDDAVAFCKWTKTNGRLILLSSYQPVRALALVSGDDQ